MTAIPTFRASSFVNSIGVNTHLSYSDGGYANVTNVTKDLAYLGVTHVRDSLVGAANLGAYQKVAATGVKFTLALSGQTLTTATLNGIVGLADSLNKTNPGSVQAMEGSNEVNNWPVTFNGAGGLAGAIALQEALYKAVHNDPYLDNASVDYFTGYGVGGYAIGPNPFVTAGLANYDTMHVYPLNGAAPAASVNPTTKLTNAGGLSGPSVITEAGYSSNGGSGGSVNQDVQAKYTLDLLFDAMKDGVSQTYLYNLLDAYKPGSAQGDDGFGLFDSNNNPKEVATALHDLTTILADNGTTAATFATGTLNLKVSGLPSSGNDLVLEKSTGVYDVAVWAEPAIWKASTNTEILPLAQMISVDLGKSFSHVQVFDPLSGTNAIASYTNTETVNLSVTDHPLIVQAW